MSPVDFLAPLKSSKRGQAAHASIWSVCPTMEKDRIIHKDFARLAELNRQRQGAGDVAVSLRKLLQPLSC